ncbi:MAG: UDP-N-acetylglucosamine 1-carboxyvinyltransferase [Elusimicrobiota bacterium]|jgi:UDP-N-acetylglucosamine 1-carboxyvinyltransferase|nr:UDP-N-acetylglucosamine 1-carboxyvinyltransferase [Elusimicrobiota bacterium]
MDKFIIKGGKKLKGTVEISGSKNAALPILMATLLTDETCFLNRVPNLRDIRTTIKILEELGKKVIYDNGTVEVRSKRKLKTTVSYDLVKQMRASFWVAGPLLTRFKKASIPLPGGCAIGVRPVDIHLRGFEKMGAKVSTEKGNVVVKAKKLHPVKIILSFPSVGATLNLMMCASLIPGKTVLENVAREPEVGDVIKALQSMGANISLDEKGRIIIEGVSKLHGMNHTVIADRIETGTFVIAAAATRGEVEITECVPEHNEILLEYLLDAGFNIETTQDTIKITCRNKKIKPVNMKTAPFPGFATDLQAPWMSLMCLCSGSADISEDIFENRFMHAPELVRMGANILIDRNTAKITGVKSFSPAVVMASDLRGGMALVIAGLCAKGTSVVERVYHIDRGYEIIEEKLTELGANIKRHNPVLVGEEE